MDRGTHLAGHILLVALAVLVLAAPTAAQSVSIAAEPGEATAPADIVLRVTSDPPMAADWRVTASHDGVDQTIAIGTTLPSDRTIVLRHAGDHTLRLDVDGTALTAETQVVIEANPKAASLASMTLGVEGSPSISRPFTVLIDNPTPIDAPWSLYVVAGEEVFSAATGATIPTSVDLTMGQTGSFVLRLVVDADGQQVERITDLDLGPRTYQALVAGDVLPLLFAGLLMLVLATWILVRDRTRPINVAFAALFIARGAADIVLALWANHGTINIRPGEGLDAATGGFARHLHPMTSVLVLFAALYFLYVYLAQNNARLAIRHRLVAGATLVGALALIGLYFLVPSIWWETAPLRPGGWLFVITGVYYPLYAVFALLLFRESVRDIPDDRRAGAFYSGLGFLFLPVFTGAGEFLFVDVLDFFGRLAAAGGISRADLGAGFELGHWVAVLALVPVVAAGVVLGRDAARHPGRAGSRRHFILYVVAVLLPLISLGVAAAVFFIGADEIQAAGRALSVFNIFQGIWTIPYPVLVAYGITRYQASHEQTRMRAQIRRFGLASVFFTVFFAVSESLEGLASSTFGPAVGLGSAAGLTLVLGPLQERLQRKVIDRAVPPEEETHQELRFYTEQVRRTLIDGHIGELERKFLLNLQETMGIAAATAEQIEADLAAEALAAGAA